jgi:hypothetical protein
LTPRVILLAFASCVLPSGATSRTRAPAVAVILRECGYDERTTADALGQKTIEMARHYARGADLTKKNVWRR